MVKVKTGLAAGAFFLTEGGLAFASMDKPPALRLLGLTFNHSTIIHTAIVALAIYVFVRLLTRRLSREHPQRGQVFLEILVTFLSDLAKQTIGPNRGVRYLPFLGTLFIFVWGANMLSMIPLRINQIGGEFFNDYNSNGIYDPGEPFIDANGDGVHNPGFQIPLFEEPTADLSFPAALAIIFVLFLGHGSGIYFHGIAGYCKEYFSPGGIMGVCMFPLNVIGKLAELVSISFRIFGNIFGGAIIMTVVASLIYYFLLPVGMFGYFTVFVGTIQAFVFTMLAATYIAMEAGESTEAEAD
ncbi:MAG: F0F1 ATP synthase subunit A [Planctomycetota bacterium]|jgi:F-type H+-transporting ATPase subunit a|nr:F0F1 ATP synthase subunit A [Planctomycetota bacterium]